MLEHLYHPTPWSPLTEMLELESFKFFIVPKAQQCCSFSFIPLSLFEHYTNNPNKRYPVDKERKRQQYSLSMVSITIKILPFPS